MIKNHNSNNKQDRKRFKRFAYVSLGTISLALGIIGILVPLLPTTPFMLISAFCYARSSEKLYNWLITNRYFGQYLDDYRKGKGVPNVIKLLTILILWSTILITIIFYMTNMYIRLGLLIIAVGVTLHVALLRSTKKTK